MSVAMDEGSTIRSVFRSIRPFVILRPHTGFFAIDVMLLLLISALHFTILPSLIGRILLVDLLTPWLLTYFVAAPFKKSFALGLIATLIMETHTSAPARMYMSLFWVTLATLQLVKASLSWRHTFPWLVTFAVGESWIIFSEIFVHSVNRATISLTLNDLAGHLARLLFAIGVGMLFCRRYRTYGIVEENPQ